MDKSYFENKFDFKNIIFKIISIFITKILIYTKEKKISWLKTLLILTHFVQKRIKLV